MSWFSGAVATLGSAVVKAGGAVLVNGGLAVGKLQQMAPSVAPGRPLTADEVAFLREVFAGTVPFDDVRVVPDLQGSGIYAVSKRPFTLGETIYLKGDTRRSILVHECVHVWQFRRHGTRYAADAVLAQNSGPGYDWKAAVTAGATRWTDINVEGQAQFVQDLYEHGTGAGATGGGAYFRAFDAGADRDFAGHRALAEDALATIRAG